MPVFLQPNKQIYKHITKYTLHYINKALKICFYVFFYKKPSIYLPNYFFMLKFAGVNIYIIKYTFT